MTCCIGYKCDEGIMLATDSAGVAGYRTRARSDKGPFRRTEGESEYLFACAGSFRFHQLVQYKLSLPKYRPGDDVFEYMVNDWIEALRQCLKANGAAHIENSIEETAGLLLVGFQQRLFTIFGDFQVAEYDDPYTAIGCGEEWAMGALYTLEYKAEDWRASGIVLKAMQAANHFSGGVCPPYHFLSNFGDSREFTVDDRGVSHAT